MASLALGVVLAAPALATGESADGSGNTDAEAWAELTRPASTIELGFGASGYSPYLLRMPRGPDPNGGYWVGSFDLRGAQYSYGNADDDGTRWRLGGSQQGLGSHRLTGEYGRQGDYRLTFDHEQLRHVVSDTFQTPLLGAGTSVLTLPAGFVRGANTAAMGTLGAQLRRFDLALVRQRSEVALTYAIDRQWALKGSLRHDTQDGAKRRGAEFGSNGGNPRTLLLPEPIDTATQLIDASLAYASNDRRLTLAYHGSIFRNDVAAVRMQNPYTSAPWTGGASGLPPGFALDGGQLGVAPDNEFHQLSLTGSVDLSTTSRLVVTATRGRMTQNAPFLPYTITPGLTSTALPRGALDGRIDTAFLLARLSMRPVRNLTLGASLRFEDRDNNTPQSEFIYVGGDIQLQPQPASNSDRIRTNLPRSRRHTQAAVDLDYRLPGARSIKAGWEHDQIRRSFAEVERSSENTLRVDLRQGGAGPWTAHAGYAHQARRGTQYLHNLPFLASYSSQAYTSGLAAANACTDLLQCVRTGPLQNKLYLADRDRDRLRLVLGFADAGPLSAQARLDANRDHYPHSPYGVTGAHSGSAGLDLAYRFSDDVSATAFYTLEEQHSRMRSRQITNPAPATATPTDADWENRFADRSATIGFGLRYQGLLGGRLALEADAVSMRGRTTITTTVGPLVVVAQNPATALPDLVARSDSVTLAARYATSRHSSVRLSYFYRRLSVADWAYDQVGVATLGNVIGSGEAPPRVSAHGVGVAYTVVFR